MLHENDDGSRFGEEHYTPLVDIVIQLAEDYSWLAIDVAVTIGLSLGVLALVWLIGTNLRDIWRAFGWALTSIHKGANPAADKTPDLAIPDAVETLPAEPRLSAGSQWSRVTSVVEAGIDHTHAMERLHGAASEQVDSALYGLERLTAELTGLVAIKQATPEQAEVHWLRARLTGRDKPDEAIAA